MESVFAPAAARTAATPVASITARGAEPLFGEDGLGFRDLLDIVNPLHHIPVVGSLYRKLTGDVIAPAFRIAGGALFGGPLGAAFAAANVVMQQVITRDPAAPDHGPVTPARPAPGGWMVAASRQPAAAPGPAIAAAATSQPSAAPVAARRGGWMVQAAYAMADARATGSVNTLA